MRIWHTCHNLLKEGGMQAGRSKRRVRLSRRAAPGPRKTVQPWRARRHSQQKHLIQAEESVWVRNLKELEQWVTTSCLICAENWEQNQFSSGNWPVTWRIMKREMLLIQKAADVIFQKPGTGKREAIKVFFALWRLLWTLWLTYSHNLLKPLLIYFTYNGPWTPPIVCMA